MRLLIQSTMFLPAQDGVGLNRRDTLESRVQAGIQIRFSSMDYLIPEVPLLLLLRLYGTRNFLSNMQIEVFKDCTKETKFVIELIVEGPTGHPRPFGNIFGGRVSIPTLGKEFTGCLE